MNVLSLLEMEHKITIAVDGFASCGKSTLAKGIAQTLNYIYIDTGAMYRAVTLFCIEQEIDIENVEAIQQALNDLNIRFQTIEGKNTTFLNDRNVEEDIRKMYVNNRVSEVAAISAVRRAMVRQQQEMGREKGVVLDGRDIGTVVFPDAELKLFMTASIEVRTQRRLLELQAKGEAVSPKEIAQNLQHRDHIDSTRADSPLKQAEDAVVIDNSNLSPDEQLAMCLALARLRVSVHRS